VGLNIKNRAVEALAAEVAAMAGENKTQAIGKALVERRRRLALGAVPLGRRDRWVRFLEAKVWPRIPAGEKGKRLDRRREDEILGYGGRGV